MSKSSKPIGLKLYSSVVNNEFNEVKQTVDDILKLEGKATYGNIGGLFSDNCNFLENKIKILSISLEISDLLKLKEIGDFLSKRIRQEIKKSKVDKDRIKETDHIVKFLVQDYVFENETLSL